jgi:hypothetical protein
MSHLNPSFVQVHRLLVAMVRRRLQIDRACWVLFLCPFVDVMCYIIVVMDLDVTCFIRLIMYNYCNI